MITQKITLSKNIIGLYKVHPFHTMKIQPVFFNVKEFRPLIGQVVIRHVHVCATNLLPNHQLPLLPYRSNIDPTIDQIKQNLGNILFKSII